MILSPLVVIICANRVIGGSRYLVEASNIGVLKQHLAITVYENPPKSRCSRFDGYPSIAFSSHPKEVIHQSHHERLVRSDSIPAVLSQDRL